MSLMLTGTAHAVSPGEQAGAGRAFERAVEFVQARQADEFLAAVHDVSVYVEEVQAQERVAQSAVRPRPLAVQSSAGGGGSYQALANCEQGGRNHPFYGFFSIIDGSAAGKSWDEQVAMVQAIKARAGAGAWDGCAWAVP